MADIRSILINNYMPYAKGTIVARAIPAIDGLKPVNRRILYTMYKMGLLNNRSKSANIVGATMRFHPHGDMAIYEALVRMTTGHEALNVPYIESKGSFGKFYSRDTDFAAPRYTEAKLAEICKEVFDGIDENAVDFVDNYDNTAKEPVVLPVKFPAVLVNTSSGIAVGTSSNIPSFNLQEVCEATIAILEGKVESAKDLASILRAPDFPTGGFIHGKEEDFIKLLETGQGTFTVSGTVELYKGKIVITEVPYKVSIESILDNIRELVKTGVLDDITDVRDESDLRGLRAVIELRRDADVRRVLQKINAYTKLRTQVSFTTRVIVKKDGKQRCVTMGILDLLNEWIAFRTSVIHRIYSYRLEKKLEHEHLLEVWEKIKNDIRKVADFIANNPEDSVAKFLRDTYGMDDIQILYLLDMKIKELTPDRLEKKLKELAAVRQDIKVYKEVVENDDAKRAIIIDELKRIKDKYGAERKTRIVGPVSKEEAQLAKAVEIKDYLATVIITKNGYMKKFEKAPDDDKLRLHQGDEIKWRYTVSNKDVMLIFTYNGTCYKVPVNNIDSSKGLPRDYVYSYVDDGSEVLIVVPSYMYKGSMNVVYNNGKAIRIEFTRVSGNRSKYRSVFVAGEPGSMWVTTEDKYFIITWNKKAAFADASIYKGENRVSYRIARIMSGEKIFGVQPLSKVPNAHNVDISRYFKGYCVKIAEPLW